MSQRIAAVLFSLALAVISSTAANAGSLTPPGAPAPTMRTMEELKPSWSKKIPAAQRFELVLDNAAVLDKETGLVWERSTSAPTTWVIAQNVCTQAATGGRLGWRLPTVDELASLVDLTQSNPALPSGHLFTSPNASYYWSSTTSAYGPDYAWGVHFGSGGVSYSDKYGNFYVRCVRGGQ